MNVVVVGLLPLFVPASQGIWTARERREFPILLVSCGTTAAEPGHGRIPYGTTALRVYPGDEVPIRISLRPREPPVPELPHCLSRWDDYLATVEFRLLRGHDDIHPSRGGDVPLRPWWDVVNERAVDVTVRSEAVGYQRPSYMPHRRVIIEGLESLPPGHYRLIGFQTGASLGRCRGNRLDDQAEVVAGTCFLHVGPPPEEGPERAPWLAREALHAFQEGDLPKALGHATEWVTILPTNARANGLLGRIQAASGDCDGATTSLTTAMRLAESWQADGQGPLDNPGTLRQFFVPEWERRLRESDAN